MSELERTRLEELLGEPLVAPDPLIDIKQVAAILGLTPAVVRGLLRSGALPRETTSEGRLANRTVRLAAVLAWVKAPSHITVGTAAGILGESTSAVHRLVAANLLSWYGGVLPLARKDVEDLAARRRDWLSLAETAHALQVAPETIHDLLNSGDLAHTGDVSRPVDKSRLDGVRSGR